MIDIDGLLARCVSLADDGHGHLRLPDTLQGFPATAHGGAVLAVFDQTAAPWVNATTPRTIAVRIHKSVPLHVALPLAVRRSGPGVALALGDDDRPLARGQVAAGAPEPAPFWEGWNGPGKEGLGFPTARGCLACGSDNHVGLKVRLRFDEGWVWSEYRPPETYRTRDGWIAPALHTVLLDEIAWWLGALAAGEAGVTTEIAVALHRPAHPFGETLVAIGPRDRVASTDERRHFWKTDTAVLARDGALLASGTITFAGSRVYSRRLIPDLLKTNPPERLRPIFPTHVP